MPNSGVFYNGGKFHVSKLASDSIEFIGSVSSATGIALADNQATGAGSESAVMPTATQVVDYVLGASGGSLASDLAAQSATTVDGQTVSLPLIQDSSFSSLISKLDESRKNVVAAIKAAQDYLEARINLHEQELGFLAADGTYAIANKLSATALPSQTAVQAFSFAAPSQATLKADMEQRFDQIHSAFDALAKASEDQDNVIEASVGLSAAGAYQAPAYTGSALQVWDSAVSGFSAYTGNDVTSATTVKDADKLLREMIQKNNEMLYAILGTSQVDLDTLQEIVTAYDLQDTEIITALSLIASDAVGFSWSNLDADPATNPAPSLTMQALPAIADSGNNTVGRGLAITSAANLRQMVIDSRTDIQGVLEGVQGEMEAIEGGAGLTVGSGAYVKSTTHYIGVSAAASLKAADEVLDDALVVVRDLIDGYHNATSGGAAGNPQSLEAVAGTSFNFSSALLSGSYSVVHALNEIHAELNTSNSSSANLQAELDRTQAAIGFQPLLSGNNDGSDYSPALASTANNYFVQGPAASLMAELDAYFAFADTALFAIQGELDVTQAGAGLDATGTYTADATTNYLQAATALKDADKKLDAVIKAISDTNGMAANGSFVAYTGVILSDPSITDMKKADEALETELLRISGDLYANPANAFGGFAVAGGTQSTFEEAINAIDTMLGGDSLLDINSDAGTQGTVNLNGEVYVVKGGASADAAGTINIASSWDDSAKEMSISLDKDIVVESVAADKTINAGEQVSAPIVGGHVFAIQEGLEAAEAISAGDVIALNKAAYTMTQTSCVASVVKADKTNNATNGDKTIVLGIAMDKNSTNGVFSSSSAFAAGEVVAFVSYGVIKGFDLSGCTSPAVGDELYLDAAGKVTNLPPSGDGATTSAYVSIHKIGMILAEGANFSDCAIMVDMKHIANDQ